MDCRARVQGFVAAILLVTLMACGVAEAPRIDRSAHAATLVVSHLTDAQRASVLSRPEDARLFVEGQTEGAGMRARHGQPDGKGVRLTFPFPLREHDAYVLHHPALDGSLEVAAVPRVSSPPRMVGIVPDAAELPSNVLRLYVLFDEAMSSRFLMSQAVEVVDLEDGRAIDAALLDVEQPLFDRTNTRLTIIFNPGRTKRGVGSNAEGGPPFEPNRHYALRIRAGLRDAEGDALAEDFVHMFRTGEPVREPLDIARWDVNAPAPGTRDPLTITFDRWIDPYQAENRIVLYNRHRRRFPMRAESSGRTLRLTPVEDWREGCFTLAVSHELEDVSGNRTVRAFDQTHKGSRRAHFRPLPVGDATACESVSLAGRSAEAG